MIDDRSPLPQAPAAIKMPPMSGATGQHSTARIAFLEGEEEVHCESEAVASIVQTPLPTIHKPVIRHLVFSGGGIRGLSYVGCLKALEAGADLQLESCAGCSCGAIMAALLTLGYRGEELYDFILHFDYDYVRNISLLKSFSNYGLEKGDKIHTFLGLMIKRKVQNPFITFRELYDQKPVKLTINACCLNTYRGVYFNYQTSPDIPVLTAIRMSIAIPVLISPVIQDGQFYVDGGITDNFPLSQVPDTPETIGFSLEVFPGNEPIYQISGIESYLFHTFGCIYHQLNQHKLAKVTRAHIVHIDMPGVSSLSTSLPEEQRINMFNVGYDLTSNALEKIARLAEETISTTQI